MQRLISLIMAIILLVTGLFGISVLKDTKWQLAGWSVSSRNPADFTITLDFSADKFSGRSIVNSYSGDYRAFKDGRLVLSNTYTTLMAGSEEDMAIETIYFELLYSAKKYAKTDSSLILYDANGNELLIYEKV